jgi:CTP-dependent riboflavin kinase
MKILRGTVSGEGFGIAAVNLAPVVPLILERTGLPSVVSGTLNVRLTDEYFVTTPDALITASEYFIGEEIKLQRCIVRGLRALIVRPEPQERIPGYGHGPAHIELMSPYHLRSTLQLSDGDVLHVEVEGVEDWWATGR